MLKILTYIEMGACLLHGELDRIRWIARLVVRSRALDASLLLHLGKPDPVKDRE